MRKIFLIVGGLLAAALAAVLVLPSFWDWNRYRDAIAAQVEAATGRDFAIEGDVRLSLLPSPSLSATRLRLANPPGATAPDMASVEALRVRLAFWPLLQGEIRAESVELIRPVVRLERMPDGSANWVFARAGDAETKGPAAEDGGSDLAVRLDAVTVTDGAIEYRRAGAVTRIADIDAEISAASLRGPFHGEGELTVNGQPLKAEIRIGLIGASGAEPALAVVELPGGTTRISFEGRFAEAADGTLRLTGGLKGETEDLAKAAAAIGTALNRRIELPPAAARPAMLDAQVTATPQMVSLDDLALSLGETRARGAVALSLGTPVVADIKLTTPRIDLDDWRAAGAPAPPQAEPAGAASAAVETPAIRANLDLTAEAILVNGGIVRDARVRLALDGGTGRLEQASAQLPGAAVVRASGRIDVSGGSHPLFAGPVEVKAGNLRGALEWLGVALPPVPADRLRTLTATGRLALGRGAIQLGDLALQVDAMRATGAVAVARSRRLSFSASLHADRLNLDAYLPPAGPASAEPARADADAKPAGAAPFVALNRFDANLVLRIDQLTYRRTPIQRVTLDAALFEGRLEVRRAGFEEMAGTQATLTASLTDFDRGASGRIGLDAILHDPPRTLRALDLDASAALDGLGRLSLTGEAAGDLDKADVTLRLEAGKTALTLDGAVEDPDGTPRYAATLAAKDPSFARVLALLLPDYRPAQDPGAFALSARIAGDAAGATVSDLTATAGPAVLSGSGSARWDGPRPAIKASLTGGDIRLDPFLPRDRDAAPGGRRAGQAGDGWSPEPIDLSGLQGFEADLDFAAQSIAYGKYSIEAPQAVMTVRDGALALQGLKGRLFGGGFEASGRLAGGETPAAAARLAVAGAELRQALLAAGDAGIADGLLDLELDLAAQGRSARDLVGALAGSAALKARDGAVRGFDLKAVSERLKRLDRAGDLPGLVTAAMSGGETRFSSLGGSFRIENGVAVSDDLRLVAEAGEGRGSARIDLPAWRLNLAAEFRLSDHPQAPPLGMQISGPIDHPQRRFQTEKLQAFLLERGIGAAARGLLKEPPSSGKIRPEDAAREIFKLFQR